VYESLLWRETELGGVYWNLVLLCGKWLRAREERRDGFDLYDG
jgi:hypothetical protein